MKKQILQVDESSAAIATHYLFYYWPTVQTQQMKGDRGPAHYPQALMNLLHWKVELNKHRTEASDPVSRSKLTPSSVDGIIDTRVHLVFESVVRFCCFAIVASLLILLTLI